jgi:hypothetical protein
MYDVNIIAGKTNFILKSENLKSANSWVDLANPQIFMNNPQIANQQISTKYYTTVFQNNPKSRLFKTIFMK